MTALRADTRGVSYAIVVGFILTLTLFAMIYGILDGAVGPLFDIGRNNLQSDGPARTGLEWAVTAWNYAPFFATVISAIGLVATALYLRRSA